jgi:hypothetical protein
MSKPDVRPPVAGHPDPTKAEPRQYPPLDPRLMKDEAAQRLFHERGGKALMDGLSQIEGALRMHEQDLDRGLRNENPEKFRWRVTPSVAIRLRAERKHLKAALAELATKCKADAEKEFNQDYPAQRPMSDTEPTLEITRRSAGKEKETAPKAPIPEAA